MGQKSFPFDIDWESFDSHFLTDFQKKYEKEKLDLIKTKDTISKRQYDLRLGKLLRKVIKKNLKDFPKGMSVYYASQFLEILRERQKNEAERIKKEREVERELRITKNKLRSTFRKPYLA